MEKILIIIIVLVTLMSCSSKSDYELPIGHELPQHPCDYIDSLDFKTLDWNIDNGVYDVKYSASDSTVTIDGIPFKCNDDLVISGRYFDGDDVLDRVDRIETKLDSLKRFIALLDECLCDETGKIEGYVYPTLYNSTGIEIPKCGLLYLTNDILKKVEEKE